MRRRGDLIGEREEDATVRTAAVSRDKSVCEDCVACIVEKKIGRSAAERVGVDGGRYGGEEDRIATDEQK